MTIETRAGAFDPANYATEYRFPIKSGDGDIRVWPIQNSDKWRVVRHTQKSEHLAADDDAWLDGRFLSPDALANAARLGHEKTRALALAYEWAQTDTTGVANVEEAR